MLDEIVTQKPNKSKKYRSGIGIIGDILGVASDCGVQGVLISSISRRANLSHYAVLENCQKLIDAGLVKTAKHYRNRVFTITEKGIRFFEEFQRFEILIQSANLRY